MRRSAFANSIDVAARRNSECDLKISLDFMKTARPDVPLASPASSKCRTPRGVQEALLFTEAIEKQQPDYPSWLLEREESVDWMAYSEEEEYWGPVDPAQYLGEDVDVSDFVLIDAAPTHDGAPWQGDGHCNACNVPVRFCTLFGGEAQEHCVSCGKVFCDRCSSYWTVLPRMGYHEQQRTCKDCHVRATGNPFVQPTPLEPKPRTKQAALLEWMLRLC
jgi:hypothetical protein